jgi:hypothetical protein
MTSSGAVGASGAVIGQNSGDIWTKGKFSSAEDNTSAAINGFVSGVMGATSSKDGLNAAMTIATETVLQTGNALAEEKPNDSKNGGSINKSVVGGFGNVLPITRPWEKPQIVRER